MANAAQLIDELEAPAQAFAGALSWEGVCEAARRIEGSVSAAGIEVRLAGPDRTIDVGVRIDLGDAKAGWENDTPLGRIITEWADDPTLSRCVDAVFGEFDAARPAEPAIFARIASREGWSPALAWLAPHKRAELEDALSGLLASLPPAGALLHLGAMPGRADSPVRVFASIPTPFCLGFLRSAGWGARGAAVERTLERYPPPSGMAQIQFDLGAPKGGYLGVEYAYQPGYWDGFIGQLESARLCDEACGTGLRQWIGTGAHSARSISHLKFGVSDVGIGLPKAYLFATPLR